MSWQSITLLAMAAAAPLAAIMAGPAPASAEDTVRISGPAAHENLAVYFIHGRSAPGPVPLTLREAITQGKVVVHETGNVNMLSIENTGGEEVFVQAGDIVKGGQQDRVLTISMLVPARSGRLDIGAFCVEQGRWSARGKEDVKRFASADNAIPSRDAKLAMMAPAAARPAEPVQSVTPAGTRPAQQTLQQMRAGGSDTGSRQSQVWTSVAKAQRKLTENLGEAVAAPVSASSLQLSLENQRLQDVRRAFIAAIEQAAGADDIVGYVFAVNGQLNSGDVYSSNGLFRKMWAKQLEAAVTEAVAEKTAAVAAAPSIEEVRAFLARAEAGKREQTTLASTELVRETRDSDKALLAETRRAAGAMVHRAYVAR